MKTEIRIEAEMTDEQCDALLSELMNTAEVIGIKLKVESNKLHQDVVNSEKKLLLAFLESISVSHPKTNEFVVDNFLSEIENNDN